MQIKQNLVSSSKYKTKCPYSMTPEFVVVHNTANDASAENEIKYMISNNNQVSFHYAVDNVCVVQGIPENRNAWHAGDGANGKGNRKGIAVEICYSKSGGDKFTQAEKNAAEFIANLLKKYNWDISHVKKHQDFANKYCPHRTLDLGWNRFLEMVKSYMGNSSSNNNTNSNANNGTSIKIKYVYNCDELNVRTGAGTNYKAVNSLACRTAVKVYEVVNGWARIEKGMWVSNRYLASKISNHIKSMEVYNCSSLNVRKTPNGTIVGNIPVNCVVSVLETRNGWTRIGANRWVYSKYLK